MREEKIEIASDNYRNRGFTCSQAVFSAYVELFQRRWSSSAIIFVAGLWTDPRKRQIFRL